MSFDLAGLMALRGLSRAEVAERFGVDAAGVPGAYEGIAGVDRLTTPVGHFYFRGDDQVMFYVPSTALEDADPDALRAELGPPAAELASRTGAYSSFLVWPDRGVAFATDSSTVEVLELFGPTTLEHYRDDIWRDPGEFFR